MGAPWFKLYPKQFLTDSKVKMLSREHRSILIDLWCYCSEDGGVPSDVEDLSRLLGESKAVTQKALEKLSSFFVLEDGRLISVRMQAEAKAYEEKCQKLKQNGTKGGRPPKPIGEPKGLAKENQKAPEVEGEEEKELPPTPKGVRKRRPRKGAGVILTPEDLTYLAHAMDEYPRTAPDGHSIHIGTSTQLENAWKAIKAEHPDVTGRELRACALLLIQDQEDKGITWRYTLPTVYGPEKAPWKDHLKTARARIAQTTMREAS